MTQRTSDPPRVGGRPASVSRPWSRAVGVASGVMCVAAVAGVIGLAGGGLDLGAAITARLPAASPVLGAIGLGLVVAVPTGAAAVAGWQRSDRTAALASLAGAALIGWIAVEIAVIRTFSWLQPVCAVYGGVLLALAALLRRSGPPTDPSRPPEEAP